MTRLPKTEAGAARSRCPRVLPERSSPGAQVTPTDPDDYVICTHDGGDVAERNLRRALEAAKTKAKLDGGEMLLSWHSLRHSAGSIWLTESGAWRSRP